MTLHEPYKPNRTLQSKPRDKMCLTLPSPEQNSKYLAPVKSHKEKKENSLLVTLYLCPWAVSPSISLTLAHKASHGERREINSSQLVLSCNALFSRTGSCSLSGHKGRINSYPANFQMDSIQSDLLAFNFPKWTHSGPGKWDVCPYAYR